MTRAKLALLTAIVGAAACTRPPESHPAAGAAPGTSSGAQLAEAPPPPPPPPPRPFSELFARPAWWDEAQAPRLAAEEDVDALWRSKPRCCVDEAQLRAAAREFDKACFQLLAAPAAQEAAAVKCLWLMGAALDGGERLRVREFLLARHFAHRAGTSLCANCAPADIVARVAGEVAEAYARERLEDGVRLLERVLDERRADTSLWVQAELYTSLGRLYLASGITPARRQRLEEAHRRLGEQREHETLKARFPKLDAVWREVAARG